MRLQARNPLCRGPYSAASSRAGTLSIMTKPMTNSTAMLMTPRLELPVRAVKVPTRKVPRMAAYLPKIPITAVSKRTICAVLLSFQK